MKEKVTLKQIKDLQPNAEVYTLNTTHVYLVIVNKPKIQLVGQQSSVGNAQKLMELLNKNGISALMIALDDKDEIQILEMKRNI
jgi:copper(I)-binding protein